jgi:hypothetical protein
LAAARSLTAIVAIASLSASIFNPRGTRTRYRLANASRQQSVPRPERCGRLYRRPPSPFGLRRGSLRSLPPLISALARRAVAREASEGWWRTQSKSNPSPPSNSLLTGKLTEFHGISLLSAISKVDSRNKFSGLRQNSLLSRTENFWRKTRNLHGRTGNLKTL